MLQLKVRVSARTWGTGCTSDTEIHPNLWSFVVEPQGASKVFQWQDTLAEMAEMLPLP